MNTAYVIAAVLAMLALAVGAAGAHIFDEDDSLGGALLLIAVAVLVGAGAFAGVGINIQYYQ